MSLRCQSNHSHFLINQPRMSLINSGFNNFRFSHDRNTFPDENLKSFFTKCNSIETPINDSNHKFQIP